MKDSKHQELLKVLEARFQKNMHRHLSMSWADVEEKLLTSPTSLVVLSKMEESGGEPDVVGQEKAAGKIIFMDCAPESPKERRSLCYDQKALDDRKEHKPLGSVEEIANKIGVQLLDETDYRYLQNLGDFDLKTSSWILTLEAIRKLGGALFGDKRYATTFVYHNGAQSYYAARGFRGKLLI